MDDIALLKAHAGNNHNHVNVSMTEVTNKYFTALNKLNKEAAYTDSVMRDVGINFERVCLLHGS